MQPDAGEPLLSGAFVRLRNLRAADEAWIEESLADPAIANHWRRGFVLNSPDGFLAELRRTSDVVCVAEQIGSGKPFGIVQAYALDRIDQHASISVAVGQRAQGRASSMEAVGLFYDYLFSSLSLHKVYSVMPETSGAYSKRATQWLQFEGCLRDREYRDGRLQDLFVYAMYRDFWQETVRPGLLAAVQKRSASLPSRESVGRVR
jgi:RimJ/RimL family protein N-acetyltransferase